MQTKIMKTCSGFHEIKFLDGALVPADLRIEEIPLPLLELLPGPEALYLELLDLQANLLRLLQK